MSPYWQDEFEALKRISRCNVQVSFIHFHVQFSFVKFEFICKIYKFSSDSNKEMHMHVLNKFIHVHSYFFIGIKTFGQAKSKGESQNQET